MLKILPNGTQRTSGHNRKNPNTHGDRKGPTKNTNKDKKRRATYSCSSRLLALMSVPLKLNTHLILTYDLGAQKRRHMKATKGCVSDKAWKTYTKDCILISNWFEKKFPEAKGMGVLEICPDSTALHFHIGINIHDSNLIPFERKIRRFWYQLTGSKKENLVKITTPSHLNIMIYLTDKAKTKTNYPIHSQPNRQSWFWVNNPQREQPILIENKEEIEAIKDYLIDFYILGHGTIHEYAVDHLTKILNNPAWRHVFQGNEFYEIREVLRYGGDFSQLIACR